MRGMSGGGRQIVVNETRGTRLGDRIRPADRFLRRLRGLLGTSSLAPGDGLWIVPCVRVHTVGMRYPLDLAFLDADGTVVGCVDALPPNRVSPAFRGARGVLELPPGTIARTGTRPGDTLRFLPAGPP
jgi:uncharacterized membrane protein (UPF0127 family)